MTEAIDLSRTFLHLVDGGAVEPIDAAPAFWSSSARGPLYDRVVGAIDFASDADLHTSVQEMHPEGDEVILVIAGAIDVVLDGQAGEERITVDPGQAAVVPRGAWHRLAMRRPGRLVFVNCRTGMQSRPAAPSRATSSD